MHTTRRMFLKRTAASAAALACLPAGACGPGGEISAGNVADYASGDLVALVGDRVAIGLDDGGLYALSTLCTHEACDMASQGSVSGEGMHCACHGSNFDANGAVTQGPAGTDLEHYAVTLDGAGEIFIDRSSLVDAADRTPVA